MVPHRRETRTLSNRTAKIRSSSTGLGQTVHAAAPNRTLLTKLSAYFHKSYLGKWAIIGVLIGVVAGLGATVFYYMIALVTNYLLGGLTGFYPPNPAGEAQVVPRAAPDFLLIPVATAIGGLISGLIVYHFAPEAEGHGTDAAISAFHNKNGVIRKRVPVVKTLASSFTIGSGGSAGREGPTAQIAAGFGSILGDIFNLPVADRRVAVAAGIGAGIGAIFKSPFGGAILSAEILYSGGDVESETLIPSFIASPVGYAIFASFTGFTPIFGQSVHYTFTQPFNLLIYAALGVLCAGAGRLYTYVFYATKSLFDGLRIRNHFKPMIGALAAGAIGVVFPQVLGLGYGFLQFLIDGNLEAISANYLTAPLVVVLFAIVLVKILATSLTVGSGGSGGVFAPALTIGGFLGAGFWVVVNSVLPGIIPQPAPVVIIGMMALFAGVGRVPIAVILMVSEMTGTLTLLAPSMVAVVTAYYLTGPKYTIYRSQVRTRADSPAHRGEYNIPLMTRLYVMDAMTVDVIMLSPEDTLETTSKLMLERGIKGIPVVSEGRVVGIVTATDLLSVPREKFPVTKVQEVMTRTVVTAYPDESLLDALRKMTINGIGRLPVISRTDGRLVGIITRTDLVRSYDKAVSVRLGHESKP